MESVETILNNVNFGKIGLGQKLLCGFEFTNTGDASLRLRRLRNDAVYIILDHGMDSIEKGCKRMLTALDT